MSTRLVVVRHAETVWNREGREMGQLDSPLMPRGVLQCAGIAERLRRETIAALYSSDLGRAARTAEVISSACGLPVTFDVGLRERDMGIFAGLTREEMRQRHPRERSDYETLGAEYVIPDGESARERLDRSVGAFERIALRHPDETVVVVTHGGVLMGIFEFVLGIPTRRPRSFRLHNASYGSLLYRDSTWWIETWNDVSHLS